MGQFTMFRVVGPNWTGCTVPSGSITCIVSRARRPIPVESDTRTVYHHLTFTRGECVGALIVTWNDGFGAGGRVAFGGLPCFELQAAATITAARRIPRRTGTMLDRQRASSSRAAIGAGRKRALANRSDELDDRSALAASLPPYKADRGGNAHGG